MSSSIHRHIASQKSLSHIPEQLQWVRYLTSPDWASYPNHVDCLSPNFADSWIACKYQEQIDWYKFYMVDQLEYDHILESKEEYHPLVQLCSASSDQQILFFVLWWYRLTLEHFHTDLFQWGVAVRICSVWHDAFWSMFHLITCPLIALW